jgi:ferric-dicitrate binding protein FerR (iron transport regulator)
MIRNQLVKTFALLFLVFYTSISAMASNGFFNVKDYGALGDGKNLDSKAINLAIESAVKEGGGTVYLPAGDYLSGSIRLKSNIHLFIDQGATIVAAPVSAENGYDEEEPAISDKYQDYGHSHFKNSLIWGYDVTNVSITGAGWINGKNLHRRMKGKTESFVGDFKDAKDVDKQSANKAICFFRSRNIILRDFTILSGGWFAILTTGVDNLTIDNLKIDTNRDGIDIDCCKNVRIKFTLPDGSFGWLNSGSTLKYALNFNSARVVQLSGEAFFDVSQQEGKLFLVKTKYLDVEVKGTSFDVAAYDGEMNVDVTLEKGVVFLKDGKSARFVEMKPNEQVSFNIDKQSFTKANVAALNFSAWKEGKLILRNASLCELAKQLSRWYNVETKIQNDQNIVCQFRATFEDENLPEVLRLLKLSSNLDYTIDERVKQADGTFTKQHVLLKVKQ